MKRVVLIIAACLMVLSSCSIDSIANDVINDLSTLEVVNNSTETNGNIAGDTEEKVTEKNTQETKHVKATEPIQETKPAFESFVAIDNEYCTLTVNSIDPNNMWGYAINVDLVNKMKDTKLRFSVESASINGIEADPLFLSEVAAGKKAKDSISFATSDLSSYGFPVSNFTDIELCISVSDSDDWMADDIVNETIHIYPQGKEKASIYRRELQDNDIVLVDNDKITVAIIGSKNDSIWGYTLVYYIVNKTNKCLMFSVDDASVNGYMADPFFAHSVNSGKCSFASMSWSNSTLADCGIEKIEDIEFSFRVYDYDNWFGDDIFKDTFAFQIK